MSKAIIHYTFYFRTTTNIEENDSMSQGTSVIEEDDSFRNQEELQTSNAPSVRRIAVVRRKTARPDTSFEAKILEHIQSKKNEAPEKEDADRLFLLSLLPMFHECSLQIKLWARIKIHEIMRQALQFSHPTQSLPPQNLPNFNPCASHLHEPSPSTYTSSPSFLPGSMQLNKITSVNNPSNYMAMGGTHQTFPSTNTPSPLISPDNQDSNSCTYHNLTSPTISNTASDIYTVYGD